MSMIGKTVWRAFGDNTLRFGTVVEEKMEGVWKFVKVDWVDDHEFKMARQRLIELRGVDSRSDWDRVDKVAVFNKEELLNKIQKV